MHKEWQANKTTNNGGQGWHLVKWWVMMGMTAPKQCCAFHESPTCKYCSWRGHHFYFLERMYHDNIGVEAFLSFFPFKFGCTLIIIKLYGPDWHHGTSKYWYKAKWSLMYTTYNMIVVQLLWNHTRHKLVHGEMPDCVGNNICTK